MTMRLDLATCYGQERLPRYTSYPTTPHFSESIDAGAYESWLTKIPNESAASLYIHVPFCRAMCWYCGCHTSVTKQDDIIEAYMAALRREVELVSGHIPHRLCVKHVHFGGGTPTILQPRAFIELMLLLRQAFDFSADAEIAVEIDPRTLDERMTNALTACGLNRASLGIQSFDPLVQRAINREQSYGHTETVVESLRRKGVAGINFDLMYGLPHQTVSSCVETVLRCLELRPERLSIFGYAHVPHIKPHQTRIPEAALPTVAERYQQFEAMAETLRDFGYQRIGLDHFCLPADPLNDAQASGSLHRNFQGYTTDPSDILLGFGASAIGRLDEGYVQNEAGVRAYEKAIASGTLATVRGHLLTDGDRIRGEIIERIMCDFEADIAQICRRYHHTPDSVLGHSSRLSELLTAGVATICDAKLRVADDARFLLRTVAAAFDDYLSRSSASHSRAV